MTESRVWSWFHWYARTAQLKVAVILCELGLTCSTKVPCTEDHGKGISYWGTPAICRTPFIFHLVTSYNADHVLEHWKVRFFSKEINVCKKTSPKCSFEKRHLVQHIKSLILFQISVFKAQNSWQSCSATSNPPLFGFRFTFLFMRSRLPFVFPSSIYDISSFSVLCFCNILPPGCCSGGARMVATFCFASLNCTDFIGYKFIKMFCRFSFSFMWRWKSVGSYLSYFLPLLLHIRSLSDAVGVIIDFRVS